MQNVVVDRILEVPVIDPLNLAAESFADLVALYDRAEEIVRARGPLDLRARKDFLDVALAASADKEFVARAALRDDREERVV